MENKDYGWFNPYWHVAHNLKSSLTYNFNKNFNLGGTMNYSTGRPYTEIVGYTVINQPNGEKSYIEIKGDKNKARVPDYFRTDVSCNYTWYYKNNSNLLLNLSVLNITNHKNIQQYFFDDSNKDGFYSRKEFLMFPILPSLRISYTF